MRDLIDAAVASAARSGVRAAVVVIGGDGPATVQTPLGAATASGGTVEHAQQIAALQEHLTQASNQRDSALRQNEQLVSRINEAQTEMERLRGATPVVQQPTEVVDYDGLDITLLNLPEKVAKVCAKAEVKTIGALREFYTSLGEHKINQKDRITTAEALMGRIQLRGGGDAPAQTPAAAASVGGASNVPTGLTDRDWNDRLKIARMKETKDEGIQRKLTELLPNVQAAIPDLPNPDDRDFVLKALSALVADTTTDKLAAVQALGAYLRERSVQEITSGQTIALLYALGFDPKQTSAVDQALETAGLVHLMESVPEPVATA